MSKEYVIAAGKAVITKKGVMGPGEEIKPEDLQTPENFNLLIEKKRIVVKTSFVKTEESDYRAPDVKEEVSEVKEEKKKEDKAKPKIGGAKKSDK